MSEQSCFVALLSIELLIPHSQSLKDKRHAIRGLKDRIRSKFNASVAEVAYQNKWQRAVLAICLVGCDKRQLLADTARIRTLCEEPSEVIVTGTEQQWL
jgi:hypothetical protein